MLDQSTVYRILALDAREEFMLRRFSLFLRKKCGAGLDAGDRMDYTVPELNTLSRAAEGLAR